MSEQNKTNLQAFGAGLLGFVAVMAVGGGALMVRSSQQSKAAARPEAAAAPIDLGSSMPRTPMSSAVAVKERRAESPAPLIGVEEGGQAPEAPAAASAQTQSQAQAPAANASSPQIAADPGSPASRLEVTQHLDKPGNGSSATAVVKNEAAPEKKPAKAAAKKVAAKLDPTGGGSNAIASVHYGVTSRNELMGRAAGPVYNFKGGGKVGGSGAQGQMAGEMKTKVDEIQGKLEDSGMSADQRAQLTKDLEAAMKGVSTAAEKPAQ